MCDSIKFLMELKDNNGNWKTVKSISDYNIGYYGEIFTVPGIKLIMKDEKHVNNVLFIEFEVGSELVKELKNYDNDSTLPEDMGEEMVKFVSEKAQYLNDTVGLKNYNFAESLSVTRLSVLQEISNKKISEWKNNVIKKYNEKGVENDNYFENSFEYLMSDGFYKAFCLENEINSLREIAKSYAHNRFIKDEDIRVYYYI